MAAFIVILIDRSWMYESRSIVLLACLVRRPFNSMFAHLEINASPFEYADHFLVIW